MQLQHDIRGVIVPVTVTEDGWFHAELDGQEYKGETFRTLRFSLEKGILARRTEVPFVDVYGRRGVMRGFHGQTRDILVTWEGDSKGKISPSSRVYRPEEISDGDIKRIKELLRLEAETQQKINEFDAAAPQTAGNLLNESLGEDVTSR